MGFGAAHRGVRGRRVSEAAIAEKKISILERALKYHPGSDELLLALLTAAETVLSPDDMLERCGSLFFLPCTHLPRSLPEHPHLVKDV